MLKWERETLEGDSGRFLDFTWGADPAESQIFAGATAIASRLSLHPLKASNKSLAELQAKPSTQSTWWQVTIDNDYEQRSTLQEHQALPEYCIHQAVKLH